MNVASFVSAVVTLLVVATAGWLFLATTGSRSLRLRGLFGRVCIQLSPDQRLVWPDSRFEQFGHLIRNDADLLTAVDFLDDADPRQSLLDRIGSVSPSLFVAPVARQLGLGHFLGLLLGPGLLAGLCLLPPLAAVTKALATDVRFGVAMIVWVSAAGGVVLSLLGSMVVWRVFFERDVAATMGLVETQPLWSTGADRRPKNRVMILPKDDPGYAGLRR